MRYPFALALLVMGIMWLVRIGWRRREDWQSDRMSTEWREAQAKER